MGYSSNKNSIEKVRPFLEEMRKNVTELKWAHKTPQKLAYYLREALAISRNLPIAEYQYLSERYTIKAVKDGVIAQPKNLPALVKLQHTLEKRVIEEASTLYEIVGAAITSANEELYFPNVHLDDAELNKLWKWTRENNFFIIVGDGTILTREDPGNIAYSPNEK